MTVTEPRHYFAAIPGESRVDEANRVIRRVSLISEGDAKGHKDEDGRQVVVDQTCLDQIFEFCQAAETVKVKIDHGSGVFSTAGYVDSFFREANRVTGNLHIYETEDEAPRIFEIARTNPRHMGISLEFVGNDEIEGKKCLARCSEVMTAALVSDPAANRSLFFSQKCEKGVAKILKTDTTSTTTEFMDPKKLESDDKVPEGTTPAPQEEAAPEPTMKEIAAKIEELSSDYSAFKKAYETANPKLVTEDENAAGTEGAAPTNGIDPNVEPVAKGKAVLAKGDEPDEEEKKMSRVVEMTLKRLSASLGVKLPSAGAHAKIADKETPVEAAQKSFESELKRHEGNAADAVKTFARVNPTAFKMWRDNGQPGLAKK
jgi:hypothetical protein